MFNINYIIKWKLLHYYSVTRRRRFVRRRSDVNTTPRGRSSCARQSIFYVISTGPAGGTTVEFSTGETRRPFCQRFLFNFSLLPENRNNNRITLDNRSSECMNVDRLPPSDIKLSPPEGRVALTLPYRIR